MVVNTLCSLDHSYRENSDLPVQDYSANPGESADIPEVKVK